MGIISFLIFGLLAGLVARIVLPAATRSAASRRSRGDRRLPDRRPDRRLRARPSRSRGMASRPISACGRRRRHPAARARGSGGPAPATSPTRMAAGTRGHRRRASSGSSRATASRSIMSPAGWTLEDHPRRRHVCPGAGTADVVIRVSRPRGSRRSPPCGWSPQDLPVRGAVGQPGLGAPEVTKAISPTTSSERALSSSALSMSRSPRSIRTGRGCASSGASPTGRLASKTSRGRRHRGARP